VSDVKLEMIYTHIPYTPKEKGKGTVTSNSKLGCAIQK